MSRTALTVVAMLVLVLLVSPAAAQTGNVEVRSSSTALVDDVYVASTRIQFQLSARIEEALASGLALRVQLDYTIERRRRFLPDSDVAEVRVVNLLRYNKVSERYTIRNENTGTQTSFATIFAALNTLGRVDQLPLVDAALLAEDGRYSARVRAKVEIADYPASLRYLLFWRDDWQMSSSWFSWSLDQ
ncbi:MAG: DUF4390 domain-containing protein [Pseudomonadota bacterium]